MAPISQALKSLKSIRTEDDGSATFAGTADPEWTIGSSPHGGFLVCLVLQACLLHTSNSAHPDPAHLTVQFLSPSTLAPFEIQITPVSTSKHWTRLEVSLLQAVALKSSEEMVKRITAHAIFTKLERTTGPPTPPGPRNLTILPYTPSEFAQFCPLRKHPAVCTENKMYDAFNFKESCAWSEDAGVGGEAMRDADGQRKLEWGAWVQLRDPEEDVRESPAFIPFFADLFRGALESLPKKQQPGLCRLPTLVFAIDFKCPFPLSPVPTLSTPVAQRTFGVYSQAKYYATGRHDQTVEVWSAPSELGDGGVVEGEKWRREAQILAVATQMAVTIPFEVFESNNRSKL